MGKFPELLQIFKRALWGDRKEPTPDTRTELGKLYDNLDVFFKKIDFKTEAESLLPENVERAKSAFFELCDDMGWVSVKHSFAELLEEKSGRFEKRPKDDSVPNWYHEFRQILPTLSLLNSWDGYDVEMLSDHGGVAALLIATLRHDSYEDFGKTKTALYASLERRYHEQNAKGLMSDDQLLSSRRQAKIATDIVEMLSKKTKYTYLDDDGEVKTFAKDFYNGNIEKYYGNILQHFFAFEIKTIDGIDGLSTRIVPASFMDKDSDLSIDKNIKYADQKRTLCEKTKLYQIAIEKWPEFENEIKGLHAMLMLNLIVLETVNDHYAPDSKHIARNAAPIDVERFLEAAMDAYLYVPDGFNPLLIQIERLETIAKNEMQHGQYKMAEILENALYPSLAPAIGDRQGTLLEISDLNPRYYEGDNHAPMQ